MQIQFEFEIGCLPPPPIQSSKFKIISSKSEFKFKVSNSEFSHYNLSKILNSKSKLQIRIFKFKFQVPTISRIQIKCHKYQILIQIQCWQLRLKVSNLNSKFQIVI